MLFITVSKTLKIAMFKSQERQHRKEISELISERDIWQLTICYWVYMVKIQGVFMKRGFRKLMGLKASCDYLQQYNFHSWFLKYETEEQKLQNWLRLVPVILQIK